jgi:hypothetical protein
MGQAPGVFSTHVGSLSSPGAHPATRQDTLVGGQVGARAGYV